MTEEATSYCNCMDFPDTFEEFAESYGIKDSKEVYTNGSVLIPVFRVKQWLDHINPCEDTVKSVFRWIPIKENPFSELPKDRRVWVTKEDSYGYRYVSDVAWDLKRFDDEVMNVVAYMDYYEPAPYKEGEME